MSALLWVKMPSKWIFDGHLSKSFSSNSSVSTDIAALKIYICLCLYSEHVNRVISHSDMNKHMGILGNSSECSAFAERPTICAETSLTYDQISELCSLSRALISRGLTKLKDIRLIDSFGDKKKVYRLIGSVEKRWCKLPRKPLLINEYKIPMFSAFTNRYSHERDALKLFVYLISIRSNSEQFSEVSRGKISESTGIKIYDIDGAVGFLRSVELIQNVESLGVLKQKKMLSYQEHDKLHRYWVIGSNTLNYKTFYAQSYDFC